MIQNNLQRLNIWLKMKNRFDYIEFKLACESDGIIALPPLEFAQKTGLLACAIVAYPQMQIFGAYLKFIQENQENQETTPVQVIVASDNKKKSGCCG